MHAREREEREAKRSRESGHYSGARTPAVGCHGRGYMSRPVHSSLPAASNAPTPLRSQESYYAPPVSARLLRGVLSKPARGGGQGGRGLPRGGGQARYYAIPARTKVVVSDSVIIGDSLIVDRVCQSCLVTIRGFDTRAGLLLLSMVDFDIILGMDWFLTHYAILDCHAKIVTLAIPVIPRVEWSVDSVPVVRDFPDVFPANLPGMPHDRDIDFGIDMLPGTQPISIPPYRMAPHELKELKDQL
ncbi:uncharacterized protein [Nicotiana sylvestris]|uniref:uncharacterized protein n=1 Tax=Nicotiana sylvestris TaxID=4096 RepID=UPI00388C9682